MYNVQNIERLLTRMSELGVLSAKLQAATHAGSPLPVRPIHSPESPPVMGSSYGVGGAGFSAPRVHHE